MDHLDKKRLTHLLAITKFQRGERTESYWPKIAMRLHLHTPSDPGECDCDCECECERVRE